MSWLDRVSAKNEPGSGDSDRNPVDDLYEAQLLRIIVDRHGEVSVGLHLGVAALNVVDGCCATSSARAAAEDQLTDFRVGAFKRSTVEYQYGVLGHTLVDPVGGRKRSGYSRGGGGEYPAISGSECGRQVDAGTNLTNRKISSLCAEFLEEGAVHSDLHCLLFKLSHVSYRHLAGGYEVAHARVFVD